MWSPDGSRIAYSDVWGFAEVVNADGTDGRPLTTQVGWDLVWSPDGSRVAFTNAWGVWVVNADGTGERQLTTDGTGPAWSPPAAAPGSTTALTTGR